VPFKKILGEPPFGWNGWFQHRLQTGQNFWKHRKNKQAAGNDEIT
jgi:hypothetical protein